MFALSYLGRFHLFLGGFIGLLHVQYQLCKFQLWDVMLDVCRFCFQGILVNFIDSINCPGKYLDLLEKTGNVRTQSAKY